MRQGNASGAKQLFEQAVGIEPKSAVARYDVGVVDQAEGEAKQALDAYRQAVSRDPRFPPALYNEATVLSATAPLRAMALYRKVIVLQPDSPTALLNLGLLELGFKSMQILAITDLRHAIRLEPSLQSSIPPSVQAEMAAKPKVTVPKVTVPKVTVPKVTVP